MKAGRQMENLCLTLSGLASAATGEFRRTDPRVRRGPFR